MSRMKQFAEQVSVDMGKDGTIDEEVLAEAQKRLERMPSLRRRLELIDNPKCGYCPHCHRSTERECVPNIEDCPKCEASSPDGQGMDWDDHRQLYECRNCGYLGSSDLTPTECGECGRAWPWREIEDEVPAEATIIDQARRVNQLCLHDRSTGFVLRRLDEESVAVELEMSDGRIVEQLYLRNQFVDGKLPEEGDRLEMHVLAWILPRESADASKYLTKEELEHGFPGFQKAIEEKGI